MDVDPLSSVVIWVYTVSRGLSVSIIGYWLRPQAAMGLCGSAYFLGLAADCFISSVMRLAILVRIS